jgi:peptidoglycan/LPS O-acetylase OafA/YrhL
VSSERADRIRSLDGLRAISIVLVLFSHLAGTRGFPVSEAAGNVFAFGQLGVHVFFVISGFLITKLLLDELGSTGEISIRRFYLRRTLRIFPAYYAFIAVLALLQLSGRLTLGDGDIARTLTYTTNYDTSRSWFVGHTWSLSVEEQFYLLWPAVFVLAGSRRAFVLAAVVVVLGPVIRIGEWELMRSSADGIGHRFETVADAIAIGCVLAGVRGWLHEYHPYMRGLASPLFVLVPLAVLGANLMHDRPRVYFGAALTIMNVGVALCVDWCVTFPAGRVGRVLNLRPLVVVGLMSYSLYLWQQLFLNRSSQALIASFPLNLALAVAAALASYYLIERPGLRLRKRLEVPGSGRSSQSRALVPVPADAVPRSSPV